MTASVIYLVRHGEAEGQKRRLFGRVAGISLTAAGRAQAEATALHLRNCGIETVHSSPLERTARTADILGRILDAPVRLNEDLTEIDFGRWSGAEFHELAQDAVWRRWNQDRGRVRAPGGESMLDVQVRAARWLDQAAHSGARAALGVSHGDVIKALVAYVLGLPLHFYDRFDIDPGGVTTIAFDDGRMRLRRLNETPHAATD